MQNKIARFQSEFFSIVGYYVMPIMFFVLKLIKSGFIFIVSYPSKEVQAPYQVWSNPDTMSIVCLIIEMIFNVIFLISFIGRGKAIRRMMVNEYEQR